MKRRWCSTKIIRSIHWKNRARQHVDKKRLSGKRKPLAGVEIAESGGEIRTNNGIPSGVEVNEPDKTKYERSPWERKVNSLVKYCLILRMIAREWEFEAIFRGCSPLLLSVDHFHLPGFLFSFAKWEFDPGQRLRRGSNDDFRLFEVKSLRGGC